MTINQLIKFLEGLPNEFKENREVCIDGKDGQIKQIRYIKIECEKEESNSRKNVIRLGY